MLNTTNTLSDTIAYTVNGTISGSLTNTGNVRADEIALDIEDDGNVGAIVNRGILSGGSMHCAIAEFRDVNKYRLGFWRYS